MSLVFRCGILLLILISFGSCQSSLERMPKMKIAVASNSRYAIEEIKRSFINQEKVDIEIISASSGKLAAQIEQGAPYDLFISAEKEYPNYLYQKGYAEQKPKVYAKGSLIFWSTRNIKAQEIEEIVFMENDRIAMANPELAPYGKAAKEFLMAKGIWNKFLNQMVYGESILQANQFVLSGGANFGFTSKSSLFAPQLKQKLSYIEVQEDFYEPLEQTVLILKQGNGAKKSVTRFYDFLFSKEARKILKDFGYFVEY